MLVCLLFVAGQDGAGDIGDVLAGVGFTCEVELELVSKLNRVRTALE